MERRIQMLADDDTDAFSMAALCRCYGVSRDTFYSWTERRAEGNWFADRSHATRTCPHRVAGPQAGAIVALRRRLPHFGPPLGPRASRLGLREHGSRPPASGPSPRRRAHGAHSTDSAIGTRGSGASSRIDP
jgi:hypothetical protein